MKTVVLGPRPQELDRLIERRRARGLDTFDESWEGAYHVAPAPHPRHGYIDQVLAELLGPAARKVGLVGTGPFNLGTEHDYRVPDRGLHRGMPTTVWVPTAAVVVEIVSPDDETYEKLPFYAAHEVDEVLIVDPALRRAHVFTRSAARYAEDASSAVLGIDAAAIDQAIDWR